MVSLDLEQAERRARRTYEWSRARRAVLGFTPALLLVAVAAGLSKHPTTALSFGAALFVIGAGLLWYGREIRRAVLPGLAMGVLPLALALCANHLSHACMGDRCLALCVPACTMGGLGAGVGVSTIGLRWRQGFGFWVAATVMTFLTGAMGCSCVGYSGVAGLGAGYGFGLLPALSRWIRASS